MTLSLEAIAANAPAEIKASLDAFIAEGRKRLSGCISAHEASAVALEAFGISCDMAYQAMPEMNQRTVRRITSNLPAPEVSEEENAPSTALRDTVRKYTFFKSLKKKHIHADQQEEAPKLPPELKEVEEAALAASVNPVKALEAVARYGNPQEVVLRRLRDLKALKQHVLVKNPTGLFVHLMRHNKEVMLPEAVLAQREASKKASQPDAKPLTVGDVLDYYGEQATVTQVNGVMATIRTTSGEEVYQPAEDLRRRRDIRATTSKPAYTPPQREVVEVASPTTSQAWLERLKAGLLGRACAASPV